ncbi:MAG: hypothetical protein IJ049_06640 [Oscillospiraceae bacterium]|nr:hypothetical protein [Oscillospiraceae bacterium]
MSARKTKRHIIEQAGAVTREMLYTPPRNYDQPKARSEKQHITSMARQAMNDRRAWLKLLLLIAANFVWGRHIFVTLTCDNAHLPANRKGAQRLIAKYLRRLRDTLRRQGRELKYIYVIECKHGEGRYHYHLILNLTKRDEELIRSLWDWGKVVDVQTLRQDEKGKPDYEAVARYMAKESVDGRPVGARMWVGSRNLKRPERRSEWVSESASLSLPAGCIELHHQDFGNEWGSYQYIEYYNPHCWRAVHKRE